MKETIKKNNLSSLSLLFALISLFLLIIPNFGGLLFTGKVKFYIWPIFLLGVLAIIFGIISIKRNEKSKKRAVWGLVIGIFLILFILFLTTFTIVSSESRGNKQLEFYRACNKACSENKINEEIDSCTTSCYQVYIYSGEEAVKEFIEELNKK